MKSTNSAYIRVAGSDDTSERLNTGSDYDCARKATGTEHSR